MQRIKPYLPYLGISLVIMAPLLLPGYLFTLDMVFTPTMPAPASAAPDFLWKFLLHSASLVVPSDIIQKAILLSIPLVAGIGMHRLLMRIRGHLGEHELAWHWAIYAGSLLYIANPFTYSRFMAGQYAVLVGYALIPWIVLALIRLLRRPGLRTMWPYATLMLIISIISIHTLGAAILLSALTLGYGMWRYPEQRRRIALWITIAIVTCIVASSYWLIPFLQGQGSLSHTIQSFDASHTSAFATVGSHTIVQVVNVLSLQGFWAEGRELYRLPQDQIPFWGTVRLMVWVVAFVGWVALWKRRRHMVVLGVIAGSLALLLSIGVGESILTAIGYREPHKFTGVVAFILAIAFAIGSARLLDKYGRHQPTRTSVTASALLLLIVLYAPTMYFGFGGQLRPREYPADWYALERKYQNEQATSLFLPWHQYQPLSFAGRTIANPADNFFTHPVIVSQDPELGTIPSPTSQHDLDAVFRDGKHGNLKAALARHDIKHIIVSTDYEPATYRWLNTQPTLQKVWHTESVVVYRNTLYKE